MRVLVVGCGDLGARIAKQLTASGARFWGIRRNLSALPEAIEPIGLDLACATSLPDMAFDYVVYSVSTDASTPEAYEQAYCKNLERFLTLAERLSHKPKHLIFVSSSSVYGQCDGEWVNEQSPCEPQQFTGQIMLEAEAIARKGFIPATVVRLAGLYDPKRPWLIRQVEQGAWVAQEPHNFANRIHRDDAAGLISHLLMRHAKGLALEPTYIGVDNAPVNLYEVIEWLREARGVTHKAQPLTRRAGSKRLSNKLARDSGWTLNYPSYKEGYAEAIKSGA